MNNSDAKCRVCGWDPDNIDRGVWDEGVDVTHEMFAEDREEASKEAIVFAAALFVDNPEQPMFKEFLASAVRNHDIARIDVAVGVVTIP